jgi:hypothetical protein
MAMADYREEDISSEESNDEEEIIKKRAKGKVYELPCVSFTNPDTAEKAMKGINVVMCLNQKAHSQ